jgi:hypothetical protein
MLATNSNHCQLGTKKMGNLVGLFGGLCVDKLMFGQWHLEFVIEKEIAQLFLSVCWICRLLLSVFFFFGQ